MGAVVHREFYEVGEIDKENKRDRREIKGKKTAVNCAVNETLHDTSGTGKEKEST